VRDPLTFARPLRDRSGWWADIILGALAIGALAALVLALAYPAIAEVLLWWLK
jgi:uncharacterized membrane protein HdeD (DUF308 family)